MFYNNKRIIYISLLILALILSFTIGKNMGKVTGKSNKVLAQTATVENKNYNTTLNIAGVDYAMSYNISNAFFIDKSTMNLNLNIQNSNNIDKLKVIAKDQNNNTLTINSNASNNENTLSYTVNLTDDVTKVNITVYPLNKDMASKNNLDFTTIPYQNTTLDVSLIKKNQIDNLQN
ncbi:hypothetical protein [Clostridium pasteurianum]|uniref:Uncharacterized protein n=1 Tax=Clostridium pasteurianum BC1 TaxID=86416 RepID=R4K226_CLOPA|nr:hypothetical protein [Clostridium pasteurianum]AGK96618.1 hypothetical protein Clopa_1696 [Clostridium pasteurianum BC1]